MQFSGAIFVIIMQLKKIFLETSLLPQLISFYRDVLEMDVHIREENKCFIVTPGSLLVFQQTLNNISPYYHFAFNIPFNKVEEAQQWLNPRVELLWIREYNGTIAEFTNWNARSVYFYDPAGNIVELIGRADLNDATDEPFSSKLFYNVSEAGVVISQKRYRKQVNELMHQYQLSYFEKQKPLEHFCAIGDNHGLLICVPEARNWYPTDDKPAEIFPMRLQISIPGADLELQF